VSVVSSLLDKYTQLGSATLVGIYLRVFTNSEELLESSWLNLGNISKLKKRCLSPDFNVQSDALETMRVSLCPCNRSLSVGAVYFISPVREAESVVIFPRAECQCNLGDFQRYRALKPTGELL
jgi:hypothetical protein